MPFGRTPLRGHPGFLRVATTLPVIGTSCAFDSFFSTFKFQRGFVVARRSPANQPFTMYGTLSRLALDPRFWGDKKCLGLVCGEVLAAAKWIKLEAEP